ncbi:NAD(P)/FAD-dependent oxidoreductase [Nocardioides sp. WS12]|uniref:flavin-containing monooxygenase n=1 Tax=Nocardioides sp. WS12 TaxID=2486272 RepID=UPI0015FE3D4D|nr:NAD(P)/FAD-dependent oxidoreductase [Nocardioides sp. WS12]
MSKRPSVAIVGSGFSGLATAIGLKQAGYTDFTIFERTTGVGGVWRHNTYPGAACDVASSLYSFSFEPNPRWSRPFAPQPEIQAYLEHCVEKYGLAEHLRFETEIASAVFDEESGSWCLTDTDGATYDADVFVPACGQLTRPSVPDLPGLESFAGTAFHSAEWDHDVDLTGKRVAVIGSGASAVQLVPEVAKVAGQLTVFQRSAEYLIPKPDYGHLAAEHWAYRRIPGVLKAFRGAWWAIGEAVNPALVGNWSNRAREAYLAPVLLATKAQLRLQVKDPELRRRLTPDYTIGCKRILLSSSYYPAVAKDHVDVVRDGITEVTPGGIVTADGVKHEVDVIIFATGFQAKNFVTPMTVSGLGGVDLNAQWADGPAAYLGMAISSFPNMFLMYGPNTNFGGGSIVYVLESQARYIVDAVHKLDRTGATYLDVRPEVYDAFSQEVQGRLSNSVWAKGGCTSWYVNSQGRVTNNWPGLMSEYRRRTKHVALTDYTVVGQSRNTNQKEAS